MCQEGGSLVTRLRVSRGGEPGNEATCIVSQQFPSVEFTD